MLGRLGRLSLQSWCPHGRRELSVYADPSRYVSGVTNEDLEKDPVLAAYFAANFPEEEPIMVGKPLVKKENDISLNIRELRCLKRDPEDEEGSRGSRRVRHERFIPGLIYGGDPMKGISANDPGSEIFIKTPWNLLQRELDRYHRNFESHVYDLTVYEDPEDMVGTVHRVMPKDVQRHPVQHTIYCSNFLRYFPGRPIKIPIVYINVEESPVMKRGGFIAPINRHLEVVIEDDVPIPERLELDCTGFKAKQVIRSERIIFPDGVKPSRRVKLDRFLVGTVFGKRMQGEEEEEANVAGEDSKEKKE
jgi:ribosomal protein L25 (general stress protein Ctc)